MGVDWFRMRPRCDAAVFAAAARAQATAFVASGSWFTDEFGHLDPPAPTWGGPCDSRSIDATPYVELAREWNRRVPGNQKVSVTKPPPFSEFLEDPSPDETLHWMEAAADEGYGLLLDW